MESEPVEEEGAAEIIIGTYEDYVVGYRVEITPEQSKKKSKSAQNGNSGDGKKSKETFSLEQSFAVRGHSGSVRSLAASSNGSLVLSAGFDEMTNLFSMKKRKLLQTTEGAVDCVAFVENSHLIFGSENGDIYINECKSSSMAQVKTLKGHKSSVTSVSVHPSGKVLLSLSKDNTMRTWNLIKGRCAYVTNIRSQAHLVLWSKSGEEFMIAANNEIYLYNNEGNLEHSLKLDKRINSIEFITNNIFIVASDSNILEFFDLKKGTSLMKHTAHEARIKSVKYLDNGSSEEESQSGDAQFVTASSDGVIKLWSIKTSGKQLGKPQELTSVDTGARLTCMISIIHRHK